MAKKVKKTANKKDGEKVSEIFEIEKKGKEKIVKKSGNLPLKNITKKELDKENKILRNVLIGIGIILLIVIIITLVVYNSKTIEYKNVEFKKIDYSGLILYHTSFPLTYNNKSVIYNEYLRINPRKTVANVPFEGELAAKDTMVINFEDEFICNGDGVISVVNLRDLYQIIGIKVMTDPNATCDVYGRYMYLNILSGNETKVVQTNTYCYNLYVKDCEILDVTERFMIETLSKINAKKE